MGRVQGRVAFITGAARGQGRSHALRLAEEGADIIAVDLCKDIDTIGYKMATPPEDLEETAELVKKTGRGIVTAQADVREAAELKAALDQGLAEFGKVDIVVAQAGIAGMKGGQPPLQAWCDVINTNLIGTINAIQVALPPSGRGRLDHRDRLHRGADGRTPEGQPWRGPRRDVLHGRQTPAVQLCPRSRHRARRAGVSGPTSFTRPTATPICCRATRCIARSGRISKNPTRADAEPVFGIQQAMKVNFVEPLDISNAVLWLASDEARYVTGMQLRVDAGGYLKWYDYHV